MAVVAVVVAPSPYQSVPFVGAREGFPLAVESGEGKLVVSAAAVGFVEFVAKCVVGANHIHRFCFVADDVEQTVGGLVIEKRVVVID